SATTQENSTSFRTTCCVLVATRSSFRCAFSTSSSFRQSCAFSLFRLSSETTKMHSPRSTTRTHVGNWASSWTPYGCPPVYWRAFSACLKRCTMWNICFSLVLLVATMELARCECVDCAICPGGHCDRSDPKHPHCVCPNSGLGAQRESALCMGACGGAYCTSDRGCACDCTGGVCHCVNA
ncbi:hypothetical protein AAVH_17254, partial [Aphelenchoides avenae]